MKYSHLIAAGLIALQMVAQPSGASERPFSIAGEITVTRVSDGDSLRSGPLRIRLFGIDAPELKQQCADRAGHSWRCGEAARDRLEALVATPLHCELVDVDRYGRLVMRCLSDGDDIAEMLVAQGLALAYRRYSEDYVPAETAARDARAGIWDGEFTPPWEWRRAN